MAAGRAVTGNVLQLRIRAEFLKLNASSSRLVLGSRMPRHHRSFRGLCQLASGRISCHRWLPVYQIQGPHGICLRDPADHQSWRERPDRLNYRTNNYSPPQRYQQQGQGSSSRNFYSNNHFQNQNSNAQPNNTYRQPYVPPDQELKPAAVNNFMFEQGKMNQMIIELMQAINENWRGLPGITSEQDRVREPQARHQVS